MPITAWAPRLAEIKASPHIHAGQRTASLKEILTRFHKALQGKTNAQHENEVQEHDEPIDKGQVHCLLLRPFYRSQKTPKAKCTQMRDFRPE